MKDKLQSIPLTRLFLYLALLCTLPLFFLLFHFTSEMKKIKEISVHLERTTFAFMEKEEKQAINKICRKQFAKKERYALEKELEKLPLLKRECEEICTR